MNLTRRLRVLVNGRPAAFFDQISLSGVNFVSIILMARYCDPADFAEYALALGIWTFAVSAQRSLVILPMIVAGSDPKRREVPGKWLWVAVLLAGLLASVMAAAAAIFGALPQGDFASAALRLALITTPAMLVYEFCRRLMYSIERKLDASIGAAIVSSCYALGVLVSAFVTRDVLAACVGMGIGGALAAAFLMLRHRGVIGLPGGEGFRQWWSLAPNTAWHFMSFLAHSTYTTSLPLIVAAIGSPAAVAALVATRNLASPALMIVNIVDSFEKPNAGKAFRNGGAQALRTATEQTRKLLLKFTVPFMVILVVFAPQIVGLMGETATPDYVHLVYLWAAVVTLMVISQPFETILVIRQSTSALFWSKLASCMLLLALAWLIVPAYGAIGAVSAALLATLLNLVVNRTCARRSCAAPDASSDSQS